MDSFLGRTTSIQLQFTIMHFHKWAWSNAWYINLVFILSTVLAYGSAALLFSIVPSKTGASTEYAISVCVVPTVFLGVCVTIMASIAVWALNATRILTWSSSPLHTVLAATSEGGLARQVDRSMLGVQDISTEPPVIPKKKQISALKAWNTAASYLLLMVLLDWCILGVSFALLDKWYNTPTLDGMSYNTEWDSEPLTLVMPSSIRSAHIYAMILLYAAILWPVTLCLHSLEIVSNFLRDEHFWRSAASPKGCKLKNYESIRAACTNWRSVLLFVAKATVHWLFGLTAVAAQLAPVDDSLPSDPGVLLSWRPWQSIAMCQTLNIFTAFFLCAGRLHPKGPQPAAYGHLQTLANLVDE